MRRWKGWSPARHLGAVLIIACWGLLGSCDSSGPSGPRFAVQSIAPADSATSVALDLAVSPGIVIVFSRNVDPATAAPPAITLSPSPAPPTITTTVGETVTVSFQSPLAAGTVYTLTITTDVQSQNGENLAAPVTSVFTTGNAFPAGPAPDPPGDVPR